MKICDDPSMWKLNEKLYSWASILDDQARAQAELTAGLSFVQPHVALMPDAHPGMGSTVGSVIPTVDAIIPAAVGVDIGCGMVAVRSQFTAAQLRQQSRGLSYLREQIERAIPLSPGRYNRKEWGTAPEAIATLEKLAREYDVKPEDFGKNWRVQLGSLGGGNHFIEVTADEEDNIWAFLHSGSRGVGNQIARRFIRQAKDLAHQKSRELSDFDLSYLAEGDPGYEEYLNHLHWAQEFARLNREVMMDRVLDQTGRYMDEDIQRLEAVNCHHNYTAQEEHFGEKLWVSRKGAIAAHTGVRGLIPGSMGTASYVVTGKGNEMSLSSAPHGAGRQYSRTEARRKFSHDDLRGQMGDIEYRDLPAFIDEIPSAYKDIDVVMSDSEELVSIDHTLRQLVNVKGQ